MIVDGNALAKDLLTVVKEEVAGTERSPHLTIITVTPDFVTQRYLKSKKQSAQAVGIAVNVIECEPTVTTEEMRSIIKRAATHTDGIVVQLPLPNTLDTNAVLAMIPSEKDVDAFRYASEGGSILPPVVGAIAVIANNANYDFGGKQAVVIGRGRLVGAPADRFLRERGAAVTVVDKETPSKEMARVIANADIIVSGAGVPHMIESSGVKDGVAIFDAGTSEASGRLVGDVHPDSAFKARLFTPVPGGIGPLTIVCLLHNVLRLSRLE